MGKVPPRKGKRATKQITENLFEGTPRNGIHGAQRKSRRKKMLQAK